MTNVATNSEINNFPILVIVHKSTRLEEFTVNMDRTIWVTYSADSVQTTGIITLEQLEAFVTDNYCRSITLAGYAEHFAAEAEVIIFIQENLRPLLVHYLNAGREVTLCA